MTATVLGATRQLAAFAAGLDLADVPEAVVHEAKRALVDWLACALAGAPAEPTAALCRVAATVAPGDQGTVVGRPERVSCAYAALVNGFASHVQDYDDTFNPGATTVHGSAPVWPVLCALAEQRPVPGTLALAAFVAGFETEARVGCAAGPGHYEVGWHVTGTAGHLGAAAAAARAIGLSAEATGQALGCAGTQAAGLKEVYGTDCKALHPGKAAMDGLLSGLLVEEGFTSSSTILEGSRGFLAVLAPEPRVEPLTDGLGSTWYLAANGYKAYPSGSLTHPTIDALLALRPGFATADVVAVEARVHPYAASVTGKVRPTTGLDAKFSLTHGAAVALLTRPGLVHFTDAGALDPAIVRLRELVTVVPDATLSKRAAVVTVTLADGRTLREEVADNRGTPDNPLRDDDLAAKFLDVAVPLLGEQRATALLADCWRVTELADFGTLVRQAGR
jgi:2-methylcitrate dehydratase PrpD